MSGMNRNTGAALASTTDAHLKQSVADILMTPIGSRVARRDYGSLLPELLDQPFGPTTVLKLYAATATALSRWEPRLAIRRVRLSAGTTPGKASLTIEGTRTDRPVPTATTLIVPLTRPA
jgi:Phage baseplate assembly protein W